MAQRATEVAGEVIFVDAKGNRTNPRIAFNPVLTYDGLVALLRGRSFGSGEQFDCDKHESRNWVSIYNPATRTEAILFDRTIELSRSMALTSSHLNKCSFHMIDRCCMTGPHRDDIIYQRRIRHKSVEDGLEYPSYLLVHAHAGGRQIAEISNEESTIGGNDAVPLLRSYLRKIGGTIDVTGRTLP